MQFFIKQLPCQHEKWLYNTLYNIKHYLLSQKRDVKMVIFTNRSRENATKRSNRNIRLGLLFNEVFLVFDIKQNDEFQVY